ncbi:MAG: cytochrome [Nevskia sp.]|nr:cytochrome [Nevskia sp.]
MKLRSPFAFDDELHPRWASLLRWVTVALLLVGFLGILGYAVVGDHKLRGSLLTLHRSAGLAVLLVTLLRIVTLPAQRYDQASRSRGLRIVALASHAVLYLALIATPLLGWALTSARGQTALFLGAIPLPSILQSDGALAAELQQVHRLVAGLLLGCIALYAVTLGWHRPRVRDGSRWRWWLPLRRSTDSP